MSLFDRVFGSGVPRAIERREPTMASSVEKDTGTLAYPTPTLFWSFGGFPSSTGVPVTPLTAIQAASVYSCIKCRSEDLGKTPIRLLRKSVRGGWRVDEKHWFNRLMRRPNPWMTAFDFRSYMETCLCLRGNAYAFIMRDSMGIFPTKLIPLSPDRVIVEVAKSGDLWYRISHPMIGDSVKAHMDNIIHVKNICLDGGYQGVSPIAAAQEAIGLTLATQQHGAVLFRQGAQTAGVIKHPGRLSPEAKDYLAERFSQKFAGVQNAFKTPVLDEGMEYVKMSMTNEDAQFLETRKFQRGEICAIFRVPPHKIMDLGTANFNSLEMQEQAYINDGLMPSADRLGQEMHYKLLFEDERDDLLLQWNWNALLRADRKSRYTAYGTGIDRGFLNQNEVREEEGLEHIPGGDIYRIQVNTAPLQSSLGPGGKDGEGGDETDQEDRPKGEKPEGSDSDTVSTNPVGTDSD